MWHPWIVRRWKRFAGHLPRLFILAATGALPVLGRYKFYVDTRDSGFGANVLLDGYWEIWLTQFLAPAPSSRVCA